MKVYWFLLLPLLGLCAFEKRKPSPAITHPAYAIGTLTYNEAITPSGTPGYITAYTFLKDGKAFSNSYALQFPWPRNGSVGPVRGAVGERYLVQYEQGDPANNKILLKCPIQQASDSARYVAGM